MLDVPGFVGWWHDCCCWVDWLVGGWYGRSGYGDLDGLDHMCVVQDVMGLID